MSTIIPMSPDARRYLRLTSADYSDEALPERDPSYELPDLAYCETRASRPEPTRALVTGHELSMSIRARLLFAAGLTAQEVMARLTKGGRP